VSPDDLALIYVMLRLLAGIALAVAFVAATCLARTIWRGRNITRRADRAAVRARVGLTADGKHLPPDDDPVFLAGQRALRKAERRDR
jgi:hypothetical protein